MIMEIRTVHNLKLIHSEKIKKYRKYVKMCNKLAKWVLKHKKNDEFLVRVKNNSFIVKSGDYGFVVGLKERK